MMKETFHKLYDIMASSTDVKNMRVFGGVLKDMMYWFIDNRPEQARDYIEMLCGIKWNNYLTSKEAQSIVSKMSPRAPWSMEEWISAMEDAGLDLAEEPYYNQCALYVVMSMVYSDSSATIDKIADRRLSEREKFIFIHDLAMDKLLDEDGVFDVRKYFNV